MDICPVSYPDAEFASVFSTIDFLVESLDYLPTITSKGELQRRISERFDDPNLAAFLLSNIQQGSVREDGSHSQFQWKFDVKRINGHRLSIANFDVIASQQIYEGPLLIIKAQHAQFVKAKYLEATSTLFPNYRVVTQRGAGHWLHAERPEDTAEKIKEWILSVESAKV